MFKKKVDIITDFNQVLNWPNKPLTDDELEKFEEYFYEYLDTLFDHNDFNTDEIERVFQFQNFFPAFYGKEMGSGKWIKINTEDGYNIYWAKHSNKILSAEQFARQIKRLGNTDENIKKMGRKLELLEWLRISNFVDMMPSGLHFTKYLKTRTTWEYVLPHQYEIIEDISLYTDAISDKMNKHSVKYKQLFTKQDELQVFYLQSRGIPKDVATMMCKLQQCYFIVNTSALFAECYQQV